MTLRDGDALRISSNGILLFFLFPPDAFAQVDGAQNVSISLLVIAFLFSVCILVISGFTLWQSHRYYLDTVRLSREITNTTTELHHKVVELIYSLKEYFSQDVDMGAQRERRQQKSRRTPSRQVDKIVEDIADTENKIRALEKTLGKLNEQLSFNFSSGSISRTLSGLSDIEYAVLLKLSQDPKFFEKNSFTSFGATPKVLDSLLSRQLIVFNSEGKAEVPREVVLALKYSLPGN
ncbi:MAG: hypothetical protein C4520_14335 [Candidatus Abyssobacteria bacterium SURF_5]|uniref:Uncharacterized protein n=1 Tax=Abyssobacteria bacterium (strain SURF_5) TaxID=2093360 RepID=A0A3A4NSI1_ABYX5|nr:MAG: hypothetical protein C4520_14335 [Candidatus Abyssubacteria bacterium SURF_5]